jgi:hypothetical protein
MLRAVGVFPHKERALKREEENDGLRGAHHGQDRRKHDGAEVRVQVIVFFVGVADIQEDAGENEVEHRGDPEACGQGGLVADHILEFTFPQRRKLRNPACQKLLLESASECLSAMNSQHADF